MKTFVVCFGKFRFLLAVGDTLKKMFSVFQMWSVWWTILPPILEDIEICIRYSKLISTQPNDLPTSYEACYCIKFLLF